MSETKMQAQRRTEFGKGAARRIRRADKIPAVLYGHGQPPQHLTLPGHETMLAVKHPNALLSLDVQGGATTLALVKDVQRDPVKRTIEHVDLVVVRRGEKVHVEVGVHVAGEPQSDAVARLDHPTLLVEAEATHLPETVEVSVEGLEAGTRILAREIPLPPGATLVTDGDTLVVNVTQAQSAEALEAELSEAEAEVGIRHEVSEAEAAGPEPTEAEARTDEE